MSTDEVIEGVTTRRLANCDQCYLPELTVTRDGENRYVECLACGHYEVISEPAEVPV